MKNKFICQKISKVLENRMFTKQFSSLTTPITFNGSFTFMHPITFKESKII